MTPNRRVTLASYVGRRGLTRQSDPIFRNTRSANVGCPPMPTRCSSSRHGRGSIWAARHVDQDAFCAGGAPRQRRRFLLRCAPLTHSNPCYTSVILGLGVSPMRRREFIVLVGSGVTGWPLAASAQQAGGIRRIGVLSTLPADDPEWQARLAAFLQGLQELGWGVGRNVRIEYRLGADNAERLRRHI